MYRTIFLILILCFSVGSPAYGKSLVGDKEQKEVLSGDVNGAISKYHWFIERKDFWHNTSNIYTLLADYAIRHVNTGAENFENVIMKVEVSTTKEGVVEVKSTPKQAGHFGFIFYPCSLVRLNSQEKLVNVDQLEVFVRDTDYSGIERITFHVTYLTGTASVAKDLIPTTVYYRETADNFVINGTVYDLDGDQEPDKIELLKKYNSIESAVQVVNALIKNGNIEVTSYVLASSSEKNTPERKAPVD